MPYIAKGACDKQRVIVSVNGEELTTWEATKTRITSRSITIPKELINRPITEISFNLPDCSFTKKNRNGRRCTYSGDLPNQHHNGPNLELKVLNEIVFQAESVPICRSMGGEWQKSDAVSSGYTKTTC